MVNRKNKNKMKGYLVGVIFVFVLIAIGFFIFNNFRTGKVTDSLTSDVSVIRNITKIGEGEFYVVLNISSNRKSFGISESLPSGSNITKTYYADYLDVNVANLSRGEWILVSKEPINTQIAYEVEVQEGSLVSGQARYYDSGSIKSSSITGDNIFSDGETSVVDPCNGGDVNEDGQVGLLDYNVVKANFGTGTTRAQGDANGDGQVGLLDYNLVKVNFGRTECVNPVVEDLCNGADINGDGQVSLMDYNIIKSNFGNIPATYAQGDANGDGQVGLLDYNIVKNNFGNICSGETGSLAVSGSGSSESSSGSSGEGSVGGGGVSNGGTSTTTTGTSSSGTVSSSETTEDPTSMTDEEFLAAVESATSEQKSQGFLCSYKEIPIIGALLFWC